MNPYFFAIMVLLILEPHLTMVIRALVMRIKRERKQ